MRVHLIGVGQKMPDWVRSGYEEYARRLSGPVSLHLREIPLPKRSRNSDTLHCVQAEGVALLKAVPDDAHVISLEVGGRSWSTLQLSEKLNRWREDFSDIALLVGGPDGLSKDCLTRAHESWSLSALTMPHMLVRVVVAEQLYRAWSLLQNHPYHRE